YFQIPIDLKDQEKTTFTCPYGTFAYRRMPSGLCNAPGTFQRCMMAIFHDMIKKTLEVFMDDFSVFRNSFQTCLSHLEKMLKRGGNHRSLVLLLFDCFSYHLSDSSLVGASVHEAKNPKWEDAIREWRVGHASARAQHARARILICFTRALIEVSSDSDLKKKVIKTIPNEEGTGYIREVIRVEYEWKPPHYVACKRLEHGPTTCLNRVKKDVQKASSMAANKPNLMADQEEVFLKVKGKDMGDASNLGAKDQKEGFTSQSSFGKTCIVEDLNLKNSFEALKYSKNIFEAQGSSKQSSMWTDELESDDDVDEVLFPEDGCWGVMGVSEDGERG
nr:reverse transcriptase domain-containing protein [Tanacetum cinerariifolium]